MFRNTVRAHAQRALAACVLGVAPAALRAQNADDRSVDSLVARALAVNPQISAAAQRARAAEARIGPAGTRPDPMLGIGVQSLPIRDPGYGDFMTMNMIALGQTLPYPGKLSAARRAAQLDRAAAQAELRATQLEIAGQVRAIYYELAFLDRALALLAGNQKLLVHMMEATEGRYVVGEGGQQDVLKARLETTQLAEEAVGLAEQRRVQLARLNALLARASETPMDDAQIPERYVRAALPSDSSRIRFKTAALGERLADSALPPLAELQELALRSHPLVQAQQLAADAQAGRADLARKAHLPDFEISLQYGQRPGSPDVVNAMVSVPLPISRGSNQKQQIAEAAAQLAALEADRDALRERLRADVAEAYSGAEKSRAQLALLARSILPQGRVARESASTAFQVGRVDFLTLVESQATLYSYETTYFRALSDFATSVSALEQLVGTEVVR